MDATNAFDSVISCSLLPLSFDVFSSARHLQAHLGAKISRERSDAIDATDAEVALGTSKKNRLASANANALKLSCELLKSFVSEAVQRAAIIAEAEGMDKIEASHFERILPQLLLDF
ncbi:protein MHF2 homolog [Brassica napus]|nr:protein MHF2 homolog [Brassica napus]